ncbi:MAG: hypothetical protein E7184_01905 [Erysipelotrichaceae bacterium]|nr:hypothetical protein [Erysipelotrichaceae bacterium]
MPKTLSIIIWCVSLFAVLSFLIITFLRIYTAKNHAKKYGMRKEITDPITYWISYLSAFAIVGLKFAIVILKKDVYASNWAIFIDFIPSVILMILTRVIGRTMILRAEKMIYLSNLIAETKDINKFVKKDNEWILITTTGEYPVSLSNTTVFRVADITGAEVEDKTRANKILK